MFCRFGSDRGGDAHTQPFDAGMTISYTVAIAHDHQRGIAMDDKKQDNQKQDNQKQDLHEQNQQADKDHKKKLAEMKRSALFVPKEFGTEQAEWMIAGAALASAPFHDYLVKIGVIPDCTAPASGKKFESQQVEDILSSVHRSYVNKKPLDGDGLHVLRSVFGHCDDSSLPAIKQIARTKGIQALRAQIQGVAVDIGRRAQCNDTAEIATHLATMGAELCQAAERLREE